MLNVRKGGAYVDCTAGTGGHMLHIARLAGPEGKVIGCDLDPEAVELCKRRLECERANGPIAEFLVRKCSYLNLKELAQELPQGKADGVLFDFGLSSLQLDRPDRGFSFRTEAPLDMRFDPTSRALTAEEVVNTFAEKELADIFFRYGEERRSRAIARKIVSERQKARIASTSALRGIVESVVGARSGASAGATRVFQALRIFVNAELSNVESVLPMAFEVLKEGGIAVAITFHSLEDRIVKNYFRALESADKAKVLTRKPITAGESELRRNPRARSAKLRAFRKV
ncbi:MAG: 16S rRNA (cytosine(1402)-N(4))-methyltransferase RsmH [Planctomycetota bacterium]